MMQKAAAFAGSSTPDVPILWALRDYPLTKAYGRACRTRGSDRARQEPAKLGKTLVNREVSDVRLPTRLPDNWRRIILHHVERPNFCPRAMWAALRDTPAAYDPPPERRAGNP